MSEKGDKIIESAKNLKMSTEEKSRVRDFLLSEVEVSEKGSRFNRGVDSNLATASQGWFGQFVWGGAFRFTVFALLIVGVGGGVAMAAEGSLPGDPLYPVKVGLNERVAGAFYVSTEAQAHREAELVEKRVKEIQKIAVKEREDNRAQSRAQSQLERQLNRLDQRLARLEAEGQVDSAVEISSRVEASLGASADTLLALDSRIRTTSDLETVLREGEQETSQKRIRAEERVAVSENIEISARRAYSNAVDSISETERFISRLGRGFESLAFGARERLEVAQRLLAQGEASVEAGEFQEAYRAFNEASRISQGTKFALENRLNDNADRPLAVTQRETRETEDEEGRRSEISARPEASTNRERDEEVSPTSRDEVSVDGSPTSPSPDPSIAPLEYSVIDYSVDSGVHSNLDTTEPVLVFSESIEISDTNWLRVGFNDYELGSESFLTITSTQDDGSQTLDSKTIKEWQEVSAFFNGGKVEIELFVAPGEENIFFKVNEVWVGNSDQETDKESQINTDTESNQGLNTETKVQSGLRLNL